MAANIDKRKKGCPNESCERNQKKIKLAATEEYCPKCGTGLRFVCAKCFGEIEDRGAGHRICKRCEQELKDKRADAADKALKAGKKVAGIAAPVVAGVAGTVMKKGQKMATDKTLEAIAKVGKTIIKR